MEMDSSESSTTMRCTYCERDIPASDFDLHLAHCSCTMERCHKCGEMILRGDATDHYFCNQSPDYVDCSQCNTRMESDYLELHDSYDCPLRIVTCLYYERGFTAVDLFEHQEMCWNRPVHCVLCGYYGTEITMKFSALGLIQTVIHNLPVVKVRMKTAITEGQSTNLTG